MSHGDFIQFLAGISILLAIGVFFGYIAQHFRIPKIIGELIGGIVLGPTLLGKAFPIVQQFLFPTHGNVFSARDSIIKIGIIFLLFYVGQELNLSQIKKLKKTVGRISVLGVALPFLLGAASVKVFSQVWNYDGKSWLLPLFIGTALSISALPVIGRILMDLGLLRSKIACVVLASATISDVFGWLLFGELIAYFNTDKAAAVNPLMTAFIVIFLFVFVVTIGQRLTKFFVAWVDQKEKRGHLAVSAAIALIFLAAAFMEKIGIHSILGAFLVGAAFSQHKTKAFKGMDSFILNFFSPLYFTSIGLQINFINNFDITLVLLVLLVAVIGKVLGAGIGAYFSGMNTRESLAIGFAMNARGAVEIILATAAFQAGFIDERIFVAIVVMAVVTTIISGPMLKKMLIKSDMEENVNCDCLDNCAAKST